MKTNEYSNKSVEELNVELIALLKEQFNLRLQRGTGQSPKQHLFKQTKKNIARVKTFLKQKGSTT